jgi:copper chaperone NosL
MRIRLGLMLLAFVLVLTACGQTTDLDAPPQLILGQDVCDECSMIINEARFAASYVTTEGEVRRFDDIGDMLVYDLKHDEEVLRYWVHDYHTEEWVDAAGATFVMSSDLTTPMAWGLAAFANEDEAEAFAAENGGTMSTLDELLEATSAGELNAEPMGGHMPGENAGDEEMNEDMGGN